MPIRTDLNNDFPPSSSMYPGCLAISINRINKFSRNILLYYNIIVVVLEKWKDEAIHPTWYLHLPAKVLHILVTMLMSSAVTWTSQFWFRLIDLSYRTWISRGGPNMFHFLPFPSQSPHPFLSSSWSASSSLLIHLHIFFWPIGCTGREALIISWWSEHTAERLPSSRSISHIVKSFNDFFFLL